MTTKSIKLSKRQKQLLAMLDQGLSNREIAEKLDISEHTVKVHFWRLFTRIGVNSRGQALKWWHDNQPTSTAFAIRAAFDAACRLVDQIKPCGLSIDTAEFDHHRAQVEQMQGGAP
jgi:DNA-binding CsgD family transcriptional regulator